MARLVTVKVHPKSRQYKVTDGTTEDYVVWTTAVPQDGEANESVRIALADYLGVKKAAVTLKRGATSRRKVFSIEE